uniref:mas-related G-protein coupled receptor member H-like n=1 Tax=Euleptes europaea TaxID=460621 RepID=UPI002540DB7D|nr:mas-related G-protein coupled receptor member H-like [Euleptes europaea]
MVNASSTSPPFSRKESTVEYNITRDFDDFQVYDWPICILTALSCLCGLVGNSLVIWLLGFCIKRNPLTTYILNLAIADFGTLLGLSTRFIFECIIPYPDLSVAFPIVYAFILFTYCSSLYLLTAISLERCLSVLFPIWYRCHRPEKSSAVVSSFMWIISGLLAGMMLVSEVYLSLESLLKAVNTMFGVNLLIFTPMLVASTLIMSIKICRSSQRRQPPRLYTAILVTLLFFIIFAIPLSASHLIVLNTDYFSSTGWESAFLFASFNSSINPIIYYFVGRDRKKCRESLKVVLKRVFRDEAISQGGA